MGDQSLLMIVDDNPGDLDLARLALEEGGVPVDIRCAYDGKEARDALVQLTPEELARFRLILLDLNMPRMNGREFLRWLRTQPSFRHIAVVVLTSSTVPTERAECLDLGANDFWVKQPRYDALEKQLARVRQYL